MKKITLVLIAAFFVLGWLFLKPAREVIQNQNDRVDTDVYTDKNTGDISNEKVEYKLPEAARPDAPIENPAEEEKQTLFLDDNLDVTNDIDNENEKDTVIIDPLSVEEINGIIGAAVGWLKQSQELNGHFRYEYSPVSDSYSKEDHIVRQTGSLYVLGEVLKKDKYNKYGLKSVVENSVSYFEENSETGEFNGHKFRCILRAENTCTLGGVSLALVGILDLIEMYPELEIQYENLITDYLNFILAMKKPNEGFRMDYYMIGEQFKRESDFSNGEAFLALVRYYKHKPTKEVKTVVDDSFDYFNAEYGNERNYNFYLWGMAAIKDLYKIEPAKNYYDFVKTYTDWRISGYKNQRETSDNKCAYFEGVISAYSLLEPNITEEEKKYYLEEINFWLTKSKELQVDNNGFINLKFGEKIKVLKPEKAAGGFLTGLEPDKLFQRIDFTQHCLSSYLQKQTDIDKLEI